jgi:sn-1 stearoyl-lipid 9-desaturase
MGEALHNNHHARPGSARLSAGPGELDPGFAVLRALHALGLVRELRYGVEPVPPVPAPPSQS